MIEKNKKNTRYKQSDGEQKITETKIHNIHTSLKIEHERKIAHYVTACHARDNILILSMYRFIMEIFS